MVIPIWETIGALYENTSATPGIPVPESVENGIIVTVSMFLDGAATVTGLPDGFEECPDSPLGFTGVSGAHSLNLFWKRATGVDSGTYDFQLSGSTFVAGFAEAFSECISSGSPWDINLDTAQETINSTADTPPVEFSTSGSERLLRWVATSWSGGTWVPPSGFTERLDSGFGVITTATKEQALQGSTGSVIGTVTTPDKHNVWMAALVGEAPAMANKSISDIARENMLVALGYTVDQGKSKSNIDLMREVIEDDGAGIITVTSKNVGGHYVDYLIALRDA
jgi:hypothetical protein